MSQANRMYVKPRDGLVIRDPFSKAVIPPEGMECVAYGSHLTVLRKHIAVGDLIEIPQLAHVED